MNPKDIMVSKKGKKTVKPTYWMILYKMLKKS